MNILKMIEEDHEKTLDGLEELEDTTPKDAATRKKTWGTLEKDLLAHMKGEEVVLYPALEKEIEEKILEAIEEHQLVRMASEVLDKTPTDDRSWLAKLMVIKENIEHHIDEEEDEIFKAARKKFSEKELAEMGERFEDAKMKATSRK